MEASISEVAGGGIRGFFLKPFDPLFRKDGNGAIIPITITGRASEAQVRPRAGRRRFEVAVGRRACAG